MKKIPVYILAAAGLLMYSSCKKQSNTEAVVAPDALVTEACTTQYLQLSLDPSTTNSYLFMVTNSPGNTPVTVVPVNGLSGNNIIGTPSQMTGISYDPATGNCHGITGSPANSLITFSATNPSTVTTLSLTSATGTPLNLSDIEKNPLNGRYYAINRMVNGTTRLVTVNIGSGVVTDMPPIYGFAATGLAINCNGNIYLMSMNGATGDIYVVNPVSGVLTAGPCPYPGIIAPGATGNAEMGLHYDCICTNRLITGNYTGTVTSILLTDGLPGCLGAPGYTSLSGPPIGFHSTVDFSQY